MYLKKTHLYFLYTTFCFSVILIGCKNDKKDILSQFESIEKSIESNPKDLGLQDSLLNLILKAYQNETNKDNKVLLLSKGLELSKKYKNDTALRTFEMGYVSTLPESKEAGIILLQMAKDLKSAGNDEVAQVILSGLIKNYDQVKNEASKLLDKNINSNVDSLIRQTALKIFPTDNPQDMNRQAIVKYSDLCEAYALTNPKDTMSAEYLFRAAEMARSTNALNKAMSLYDMILGRYPNHSRALSSLFVKAYIHDTTIKDFDKAKELYNLFLSKYPNDPLAKDVKVLLENIGKSDEEILRSIKNKGK